MIKSSPIDLPFYSYNLFNTAKPTRSAEETVGVPMLYNDDSVEAYSLSTSPIDESMLKPEHAGDQYLNEYIHTVFSRI